MMRNTINFTLHTHNQAHLRDCTFAPVVCDSCKETMQRRLLAKHAADACVNRTVTCTHCHEAIQARLLSEHCNSKCQLYPVTCPNDCKQFVTRGVLSSHLTSCPLQVVFCAYAHVGCTHKCSRAEVAAHLGDPSQVAHHLALTEKHLSLTERRLSQVEQRLSMQESISVKSPSSLSSVGMCLLGSSHAWNLSLVFLFCGRTIIHPYRHKGRSCPLILRLACNAATWRQYWIARAAGN